MTDPVLDSGSTHVSSLGGWMGERVQSTLRNWMQGMPNANPALLQMFRDRDSPYPEPKHEFASDYLLKWSGEFAGKYLIAGAQFLRLTGDFELKASLEILVKQLIAYQDSDGYLGAFERQARMLGKPGSMVWTNFFPAPTRPKEWNGWFPLGDNVFPVGAAVTALSTVPGGTSLYVLGLDGKVWSNFFPAPDGSLRWNGWFALGDNIFPGGATVTALSTVPGGTSLYVLGRDGGVWTNEFPSPDHSLTWDGWWPLIFPPYISWLAAPPGTRPVAFSRSNPQRACWPNVSGASHA